MKIKTPRTLAKKYARRATPATASYIAGVMNPRVSQAEASAAAAPVWAAAVEANKSKWAKAWAPFREVLLGLKLPPRGKKGSKANTRRVGVICEALHQEKLRRKAMARRNGVR